jgi:hypothetical protein
MRPQPVLEFAPNVTENHHVGHDVCVVEVQESSSQESVPVSVGGSSPSRPRLDVIRTQTLAMRSVQVVGGTATSRRDTNCTTSLRHPMFLHHCLGSTRHEGTSQHCHHQHAHLQGSVVVPAAHAQEVWW